MILINVPHSLAHTTNRAQQRTRRGVGSKVGIKTWNEKSIHSSLPAVYVIDPIDLLEVERRRVPCLHTFSSIRAVPYHVPSPLAIG
jgi:hypothetical protein